MKRMIPMVLVLLSSALLTGCNGPLVRVTREVSISQPWSGCTDIEVRVVNGSVELRKGETDNVRVTGIRTVGGATAAEATANMDQVEIYTGERSGKPGTLLVELRYPEELRTNSPGAKLLIEVPEACPADVRTSNGSVRATGMKGQVTLHSSNGTVVATQIEGSIVVETSNGKVDVSDSKGDVKASTSNGHITTRAIDGSCELRTSNGGIEIADVQGSAVAETSNGSIRASVAPPVDGQIDLRASNGGIHLTLPKDVATELEAGTSNGRVHVDLTEGKLVYQRRGKAVVKATYNGGGGKVRLVTSNGEITVDGR